MSSGKANISHGLGTNSNLSKIDEPGASIKTESTEDVSSKRKYSEDESDNPTRNKVVKVNRWESEIFKLTSDEFLYIFPYLTTNDLVSFGSTCHRFARTVKEGYKFRFVSMRCDGFNLAHKYYLKFLNEDTEYIEIRNDVVCDGPNAFVPRQDDRMYEKCIDRTIFKQLMSKAKNLKTLVISNHDVGLEMKLLPRTLHSLLLNTVTVAREKSICFFCNVSDFLPNLQIVDIAFCNWLEPHQLMPFARLPYLRVLRLTHCPRLRELIPYAAVACSQGFPCLEIIDFRFSPVSDTDIVCFNKIRTLREIHLQRSTNPIDHYIRVTDYSLMTFNDNYSPINEPDQIYITPFHLTNGVNNTLQKLIVRDYSNVGNQLLNFAMTSLRALTYLDMSGTSCSNELLETFRERRPDVTLVFEEVLPE